MAGDKCAPKKKREPYLIAGIFLACVFVVSGKMTCGGGSRSDMT
jgi:hypothetical protein